MGRGSRSKRISYQRRDSKRWSAGLSPNAWVSSLNGYLLSELNAAFRDKGYMWGRSSGYVSCALPSVDCAYLQTSKTSAKLVVHIGGGNHTIIEEPVSMPPFPEERSVVRKNIEKVIKPLLDDLIKPR